MTDSAFDPDFKRLLARAFDQAWERYFARASGRVTIAPAVARPELAKHLVELAKAGERDEIRLVVGGVSYLRKLSRAATSMPSPVLARFGTGPRGEPSDESTAKEAALTDLAHVSDQMPPSVNADPAAKDESSRRKVPLRQRLAAIFK